MIVKRFHFAICIFLLIIDACCCSPDHPNKFAHKKKRIRVIKKQKYHLASAAELNELSINQSAQKDAPIFQPKQTEPPNEEDYNQIDDYYDYDSNSDYSAVDVTEIHKKPDVKTTTSSSKWITKNATAPSKFNLNSIFDFVEYILRPTNPNENTVESLNKLKSNDNDTSLNFDYLFPDDNSTMPDEDG